VPFVIAITFTRARLNDVDDNDDKEGGKKYK
jgi:hypothetical protein